MMRDFVIIYFLCCHMQTVRVSVTRNQLATTRLDYYLLCIISGWSMTNKIYDYYLNVMTNCLIETIDYLPCFHATFSYTIFHMVHAKSKAKTF